MSKTPVWKSITATLEREIAAGHYRARDKLPTEAELSARFGVNRHTVRRALGDLAERGIVRSRRGAGVFVATEPTIYPIGKRTRFHRNIEASGRLAGRKLLRLERRPADEREAQALDVAQGEIILVFEGLSLSGDVALAHFHSVFPLSRLDGMEDALRESVSITTALEAVGIPDYVRRETRLTAERASPTQALHLGLRDGDPVLHSVAINTTPDGTPVELGSTWFAGDKVTLTVGG